MLALVLALSLGVPAFAAVEDTGFSDVDAGAWYAGAVMYCREHGLMDGTGYNRFSPESSLTRAQLATVLYRIEGEPAVAGTDAFTDTADGAWYSDAKILIAYFTVPETSGIDAVAQASRVVENGEVVGNVEFIANTIQEETGGDMFAIETVQTYPGEHQALLDFAAAEMAANARPELSDSIGNLSDYDVIFVGYPIWWDDAPAMMATFLAENDFSGKVVAPFCTSSYSSIDNSLHIFRELASGAALVDGLTANSESAVQPWVNQVLSQAAR